jgi:D-alanine-D-alanine ligase
MKRKKINVAVIMGGRTAEHEISLATGEMIVSHLERGKYSLKPVVIDRGGRWHVERGYLGKAKWSSSAILQSRINALPVGDGITVLVKDRVDVAFIAMHGPYGEDGTIQGMMEIIDIPYTGSNVCASALAMNKDKAKEIYIFHKIPTPHYTTIEESEWGKNRGILLTLIEKKVGYPCVIKPMCLGSSVGSHICPGRAELQKRIPLSFKYDYRVLIETRIDGREITCAVIDTPRGKPPLALPPTEIVPRTGSYFDYEAKYTPGAAAEITPAPIGKRMTSRVQALALKAHRVIGCSAMSRTDMIMKGNRIYVLETNTIPGMTGTSLLPQAAKARGLSFPALLDRIITVAIEVHERKRRHRQVR